MRAANTTALHLQQMTHQVPRVHTAHPWQVCGIEDLYPGMARDIDGQVMLYWIFRLEGQRGAGK